VLPRFFFGTAPLYGMNGILEPTFAHQAKVMSAQVFAWVGQAPATTCKRLSQMLF